MSTQWVQHISGQGEKWEVSGRLFNSENTIEWQVLSKASKEPFLYHYLPRSEYRLCPAPERWVDVTEACEITPTGLLRIINSDKTHTYLMEDRGYRFRKVPLYDTDFAATARAAFIIEQKVSE